MEQTTIVAFCLFLFYITTCPQVHSAISSDHRHRLGQGQHHHDRSVKLFVFGDSYADTGNSGKFATGSWKAPYGITFPGKPAGRFSDGRVLTDYIGSFILNLYRFFHPMHSLINLKIIMVRIYLVDKIQSRFMILTHSKFLWQYISLGIDIRNDIYNTLTC